ncbi:SusC/RagA family TonB-linked outer membrane protein [Labilibaculum sp. DW002]|uniref:SusC/RagA family TonB-linked outer membrane protein n=1 Tax=Paralabilibaculum antarcticum TaxID=2912572 RepID=A0ABT5VYB5_9BACT|nr:SusC/RagA family TonB-linked outer membrane protein [Labilibaculum sp. DW002]MDE5420411.1 SusC/RagA family TonB-linked outer membrane protein [Labilibaculum sp. DW002]
MRKIACFTLIMLLGWQVSWAQDLLVTGTVTNSDKVTLPGVSIVKKGTTTGTTTDIDGKYELKAEVGTTLVFSFVGMEPQEIGFTGQKIVDVVMAAQSIGVDEVIVTALGIKKSKKSLGYAVQNIKSEELLAGNQSNMVNSLQGKIAGVSINSSGGSPGASSIIMIRGGSSLSGNNQPLFIVDGLPIDNSTNSSSEVASANRASDINPEDIESISVLKGATAAALYGIQAAEGAIIITTKKGKTGEGKISFSSTLSVDKVLDTPDIQSAYGQGSYDYNSDGDILGYDASPGIHLQSWGEEIPNGTPTYDNISNLFETAITQKYNVNYSGGNEQTNIFASASYLDQNGVIENTGYEKLNLTFNAQSKFRKNLTIGVNAKYINTQTESNKQGTSSGGSYISMLKYPVTYDARDYANEDGTQKIFMDSKEDQEFDNPYWSLNNSPNNDKVDRLIGQVNLNYKPFDFLTISYRIGTDFYSQFNKKITDFGSLIKGRSDGHLRQYEKNSRLVTSTLLAMFNKTFDEDYSIDVTLGQTVDEKNVRTTYTGGNKFQAPDIYSVSNIAADDQTLSESKYRRRSMGVFGEAKFGWKNIAFLNVTGRNDWSSTLPIGDHSFFYPSVGTSVVVSDLLKEFDTDITSDNFLSYLKLRATWAQVGKDASAHMSESYLTLRSWHYVPVSDGYTWNSDQAGNPNLKPEFTTSFEIGMDARFLKNRIKLDFSYYHSLSEDQLLNVRLPPAAGAYIAQLNGGSVKNEGYEALVNVSLFPRSSEFQWDMSFNFAKMESTVYDLPGELVEVNNDQSWTWNSTALGAAVLDGNLFGLKGKRPKRNENGDRIVNSDGNYSLGEDIFPDVDRMPDWTMGIINSMSYKNFRLSFLLDMSIGGDVYNATNAALTYYGLSTTSEDRSMTETIILDGVVENGVDVDGNSIYEKNTTPIIKDQNYYQDQYSQNAENFIEDATFVKLRYVTLSYNLPKTLLDKIGFDRMEVFATGRNLLMISDYSGVDPEIASFGASVSGSGAIGLDNLSTPNTKGFDLGVKINF